MAYSIRELAQRDFPPLLNELPDPPKKLYCSGNLPAQNSKILCVVGSRRYSQYGQDVCNMLIKGISGYPISIVSGLALGIDSIAHKAALESKLHTIAVPGSGLNPKVIYPKSHLRLAENIVESGGALLSEFENDFEATAWSFPQRNRIMAGMSHAVLVIEAENKSGTLITSRLATEYNRDVFTVPGSIYSRNSSGPHMLIKLGATLVENPEDLIKALGFEVKNTNVSEISFEDLSEDERMIAELLHNPTSKDDLTRQIDMPASKVNMLISAMEIKGIIKEEMGEMRLNKP